MLGEAHLGSGHTEMTSHCNLWDGGSHSFHSDQWLPAVMEEADTYRHIIYKRQSDGCDHPGERMFTVPRVRAVGHRIM